MNYISPELVQCEGLQVLRGQGWPQNKRLLHGDMKTSNLFVFTGAQDPVMNLG